MIKQHAFNELKCDYCGKECYNFFSVIVDGQWYNGHKKCMPKLKKECEEALENLKQKQSELMNKEYEMLKRDMR